MGFLRPTKGRVLVAGEDISQYSESEMERMHKRVTMVFQSGALFDSLTVAENVAFPLLQREGVSEVEIAKIVDDLLVQVGLRDVSNRYPAEISVGEKRAVAIARALAATPEAILFDEPTTMVDPIMAKKLTALIEKLKSEMKITSVIVTHDMQMLEALGGKIVFLEEGKVLFDGKFEEMERSPFPIVKEFLRLGRFGLEDMMRILKPQKLLPRRPAA